MDERELTELFRNLGADDPAGWARSQLEEGLPQLARFLFLRQAWKLVVKPDDSGWITAARQIDASRPGVAFVQPLSVYWPMALLRTTLRLSYV